MIETPKVFISYSWSSEEHVDWVLNLAKKLKNDGVTVIIDRWSLKPGQDKNDFMEKMVKDDSVNKVLIICDKQYSIKADSRKGGVGIESQIISPKIYEEVNQEKFIPIAKEKDEKGNYFLPVFLKSRFCIDLTDPLNFYEGYEELLCNIYNKPLFEEPPLGHPPTFILEDNKPRLQTTHKFLTFKDAVFRDKPFSNGLAKDYLNEVIHYFETININKEEGIHNDELFLRKIDEYIPLRDEFIEFVIFINSYKRESLLYEEIHKFFSSLLKYIRTDNSINLLIEFYKYAVYELFLYLTTILIQDELFPELSQFLNNHYFYSDEKRMYSTSTENLFHYTSFRPYLKTLEEERKQRLKLNVYNVTSGVLRERINKHIPIVNLVQADYLLFIRSHLTQYDSDYIYNNWFPYTLLLVSHGGTLPVFLKATSKGFFTKLLIPFQIKSVEEFKQKIELLCEKGSLPRFEYLWQEQCLAHKVFLNLEKLATIN